MPNMRDRIRLTEDELREFLETALTLQVASIGKDGYPHLVPMRFALDSEGLIVFTSFRAAQKVRNIERDPRVTVLVEEGTDYDKMRAAMIKGDAELLDDLESTGEVLRLVRAKYYGEGTDSPGLVGTRSSPDRSTKRVGIRIRPKSIVSWDHSKLLEG